MCVCVCACLHVQVNAVIYVCVGAKCQPHLSQTLSWSSPLPVPSAWLSVDTGELNSGPCICLASALPTEPSPCQGKTFIMETQSWPQPPLTPMKRWRDTTFLPAGCTKDTAPHLDCSREIHIYPELQSMRRNQMDPGKTVCRAVTLDAPQMSMSGKNKTKQRGCGPFQIMGEKETCH